MLPVIFVRRNVGGPMLTWDPVRQFGRMARPLDPCHGDECETACRGFEVDVREDDDHYYIEANLPGVDKDAIDVTLEDGVLTLSAENDRGEEQTQENFHVRERYVGKFSRAFRLASEVDGNQVDAKLSNGVLTVTLNKSEAVKPRKIAVAVG